MRLPIKKIQPTGSEPLYEEADTGLFLTATDFAARNGYRNEREVEEAYNDRRTAESDNDQTGSSI
jgi:hypothetical protein